MAIYSTLIQAHAARRASSFHLITWGMDLDLAKLFMQMPPWKSRMMGSVPECYSKQRKKDSFCLKLTSTGITTGAETWKWSCGSSLCSECQQSPGKACKSENRIENCRQLQMLFSIHQAGKENRTPLFLTAVSLSEQHLVKSLKAAAQNQKKNSWGLKKN